MGYANTSTPLSHYDLMGKSFKDRAAKRFPSLLVVYVSYIARKE